MSTPAHETRIEDVTAGELLKRAAAQLAAWNTQRYGEGCEDPHGDVLSLRQLAERFERGDGLPRFCVCGHAESYHRPYCHGNPANHCREFVAESHRA